MRTYDPTIADVIKSTVHDAQDLVRGELALAKAELRDEARRVGRGVVVMSIGAVAGLIALVFLLTAAAWAIPPALDWPIWTGFALVGGAVALIALVMALVGRGRLKAEHHMPLTVATMKENMQWMRAQRS